MSQFPDKGQQATQFDLTTSEGVLAYLAATPFASARVEPLSGGNTNFIYRLYLNTPYEGRSTLALKHARPYSATAPGFPLPTSRQEFEVGALRHIRASEAARVSVPAVHHFDNAPDKAVIIMDDAGPRSLPLKAALLAGRLTPKRAAELGTELGAFLRVLHARGRRDADADGRALREALERNVWGGEISAWATYGRLVGATLRALDGDDAGAGASASAGDRERLVSVLGDEPLGVSEETLRVVEALAERRATQIREAQGDAFLMGDFWPGNILVGVGGDKEEGEEGCPRALVVDWEVARIGLAGLDVGQFCAELATLRRLRPERAEAAGEVLKGFVRAYFAGDVGPEADETRRVALGHFGVHLAVWTPRTGWDGGAGPTRALMLDGVARLVEGADANRIWTDEELVQKFLS